MLLDVSILNHQKVVFKGPAVSVTVPGEKGVFEILVYHRPILSRLISGTLYVDEKNFPIKRGIVQVNQNKVNIIVEEM